MLSNQLQNNGILPFVDGLFPASSAPSLILIRMIRNPEHED
jgi:hypothetical protein